MRQEAPYDHERIQPGLEVHNDQQINESDCEHRSANEAGVRLAHRPVLAAQSDEAAARQLFAVCVYDPVNVLSDRAKIAILKRSIDFDNAANVVVINGFRFRCPMDRCDIRKQPVLDYQYIRRGAQGGHNERFIATGRIEFSAQLVDRSITGWSRNRAISTQRFSFRRRV